MGVQTAVEVGKLSGVMAAHAPVVLRKIVGINRNALRRQQPGPAVVAVAEPGGGDGPVIGALCAAAPVDDALVVVERHVLGLFDLSI